MTRTYTASVTLLVSLQVEAASEAEAHRITTESMDLVSLCLPFPEGDPIEYVTDIEGDIEITQE